MSPAKGTAIYNALSGASAITDIVGTRIYRNDVREGTAAPYVVLFAINAEIPASHNEATAEQTDSVQITCFANDFETASTLRAAVRTALDNVALSTGESPTPTDEREGYEAAVRLHRCDIDFDI